MSINEGQRSLQERLALGMVASCKCETKTNDPAFHEELCPYRLMSEALQAIEGKDARIDGFRAQVERANKIITDVAQASFIDDSVYPALRAAQNYARTLSSTEQASK